MHFLDSSSKPLKVLSSQDEATKNVYVELVNWE